MILHCAACSAQNFVSDERRAVAETIPPRCWQCGEPLPQARETGSGTGESYKGAKRAKPSGSMKNG